MAEGGACLLRQKAFCNAVIDGGNRSLWVDTVEKGKNEPIKIFAFASVETGFS
jgi:hypothetical protein